MSTSSLPEKLPLNKETYLALHAQIAENSEGFWEAQATSHLMWCQKWDTVCTTNPSDEKALWFAGAKLNAAHNCLDRHLQGRGEQAAILWEPNDPNAPAQEISYIELHALTCRLANMLAKEGVQKGDKVCLYMPSLPQTIAAMLACARLGAVHVSICAKQSADFLVQCLNDTTPKVLFTTNAMRKSGEVHALKSAVDTALEKAETPPEKVLVFNHLPEVDAPLQDGRDICVNDVLNQYDPTHTFVHMEADAPLFILYTNDGQSLVYHTGGYLVYAASTHSYIFDYQDNTPAMEDGSKPTGALRYRSPDVYWCMANLGSLTGHTYSLYGPLANGATLVLHESTSDSLDGDHFHSILHRHNVKILYASQDVGRHLHPPREALPHPNNLHRVVMSAEEKQADFKAWLDHLELNDTCTVLEACCALKSGGIAKFKGFEAKDFWPFLGLEPSSNKNGPGQPQIAKF